jgi:hypothetical protein
VLCERTLLAAVTLQCRLFLCSLPALLSQRAAPVSESSSLSLLSPALLRSWRAVTTALELALEVAWRATAPPVPSLVESLSELSRNLLLVTAAELRAGSSSSGSTAGSSSALSASRALALSELMELLPLQQQQQQQQQQGSSAEQQAAAGQAGSSANLRTVAMVLGLLQQSSSAEAASGAAAAEAAEEPIPEVAAGLSEEASLQPLAAADSMQ